MKITVSRLGVIFLKLRSNFLFLLVMPTSGRNAEPRGAGSINKLQVEKIKPTISLPYDAHSVASTAAQDLTTKFGATFGK